MRTRATRFAGFVVGIATLLAPASAVGQQVDEAATNELAAVSVKSEYTERLRALPAADATRITLASPEAAAIDAIRAENVSRKRLQIGVGRSLEQAPGVGGESLAWRVVPGGLIAHWLVTSVGARALRVGLEAERFPPEAELRFVGTDRPDMTYGPFRGADLDASRPTFWGPVLEGEGAVIEVFLPQGTPPSNLSLALTSVAHLFVSPSEPNAEMEAKASGACEVDLICRSATDTALAFASKSVVRMAFNIGTTPYLCTGTLMVTSAGVGNPYLLTSAACIDNQASASSLTTHWFYERTGCGFGSTNPAYVQRTGGAALLYANPSTDVSFMRLNAAPPGGAVYAGWSVATLASGVALTGVHHPGGDWKKVSLGQSGGFSAYGGGAGSDYLIVLWNSTATGVTEPGSAGSPVFSFASSTGYHLRGALRGGPSSCSASGVNLRDYYSRFDQAHAAISAYLSPPFSNLLNNPGFESGATGWGQTSTGGYALINSEPSIAFAGSYDAWLGGYDSGTDTLYQDVFLPGNADRISFDFRYRISTTETGSTPYDTMTVALVSPTTGAVLQTLVTYSNVNAGSDAWQLSSSFDLSAFRGQTVRLRFTAVTDSSLYTNFRLDEIRLLAVYTTINEADVSITQSLNPNPANASKDVVVSLTARNFGPGSPSATVNYTVPAGTALVWFTPACTNSAGNLTCPAGTLAVGGVRTFKVVLRPFAAGSFNSNASVTSSLTDPSTANNAWNASVTINSTPPGVPVSRYRLYSPVTLEHHFTTDQNEYNVLGSYAGTWVQEGTIGRVLNNPGSYNGVTAVPYYRLYDTITRWHHWTTDANEYYTLADFPWWNAEGVDGYLLPSPAPGSRQFFRLLYPWVAGLHHWTSDANEYSVLINQYGWIGEGGSGYVIFP